MRIAITGTIGSGKSTVAKILEAKGYKVIYTDVINEKLLNDTQYIKIIQNIFPDAVIDNRIDKKTLSKIVFSSDINRKLLNRVSHPLIKIKLKEELLLSKSDYIFVEIPLLIESGMEDLFDKIWLVRSDKELQMIRVKQRDGRNAAETETIIAAQKSERGYSLPVTIIQNDGDINSL